MNENNRQAIERLKKEIASHERIMDNCSHEWKEVKYDPEHVRVPYGGKYVGPGSDPVFEPEGYRDDTKDRWSRECKNCGKIQYTYHKEPIISEYRPKF